MFIYTLKGQNLKVIISLVLSAFIILAVVLFFPDGESDFVYPDEVLPAVKSLKQSDFKGIETNEDRVHFISLYGWEVEPEAKEIQEVTIPKKFDEVYKKYNQLQIGEGLNLESYRGKQVKRYTYLVTNYDYEGEVFVNLLVYKDRVIGGDVSSARLDGFVHGFTKGNDFLT